MWIIPYYIIPYTHIETTNADSCGIESKQEIKIVKDQSQTNTENNDKVMKSVSLLNSTSLIGAK